jgi:hypothetical protein
MPDWYCLNTLLADDLNIGAVQHTVNQLELIEPLGQHYASDSFDCGSSILFLITALMTNAVITASITAGPPKSGLPVIIMTALGMTIRGINAVKMPIMAHLIGDAPIFLACEYKVKAQMIERISAISM